MTDFPRTEPASGKLLYLAQDGDTLVILFGGSTKRSQQKAIDQAVALHEE